MTEPAAVKSLITPFDQTLRKLFNAQRSYFIDIYQREYKWAKQQVTTLLNDIELRFNQHDRRKIQPKDIQTDVMERFEPYFMDTYLTSTTAANTSVVDGQQRLTTFLLILIKLHRLLKTVEANEANKGKTFSSKIVEQLIFEADDFGGAKRFKIYNENREAAFQALVDGESVARTDQTRTQIAENFAIISQYFDDFLKGPHPGAYDLVKTTYYLTYLLDRISIVEIRIERQENVAMIFEVVNDRGMGLKPYEILKGKLIGTLPQTQKEKANAVWTELQERYFKAELKNTTEKKVDLDLFFQTFFRAKFADSENDYEKFEGAYHYEMYRNEAIRRYFGEYQNRELLYERITGDIEYFADLYLRLRTGYDCEPLIFNKLLDQNQQYLLILSAVTRDDYEAEAKIAKVATKFDQLHVILRLLEAHESGSFQRLIYPLNKEIRDKPLAEIGPIFEQALIENLVEKDVVPEGQFTTAEQLFEFERFKGVRNQATNFSKYVLMRIDRWLATLVDKPSFALSSLEELEHRFNKNNRRQIHAMQLEHIYARNDANLALFTNAKGIFDEAMFNQVRNLLGMVLLLKDTHNWSSNNDLYAGKQEIYSQSSLVWNELLVGHLAPVDARYLPPELKVAAIRPVNDVFPRDQVESRQRVIFEAIRHIWAKV